MGGRNAVVVSQSGTVENADGVSYPAGREAVLRLSDIRMHDLDISVPNEKQIKVYQAMAGSAAGRAGLPKLTVGYWIGGQELASTKGRRRGSPGGARAGASAGSSKRRGSTGGGGAVVKSVEFVPPFYFLTGGGDAYRGMRRGGMDCAACIIRKYESESDFLAEHALENQRHTTYNPLKLNQVVRWMQYTAAGGEAADGSGRTITKTESDGARLGVEKVMRACRDTVDQKFINLGLDGKVVDIISDMCAWLGTKLSRFDLPYYLPYYLPYQISKVPPDVQVELADHIVTVIKGSNVTDTKFSWPSPEMLAVMADTPKFRGSPSYPAPGGKSGGKGVTVAVPKKGWDDDEEEEEEEEEEADEVEATDRGGGHVQRGKKAAEAAKPSPAAREAKKTERKTDGGVPLENMRDVIIIPGSSSKKMRHPPFVIDIKTRRVSVVESKSDITVLREIGDAASRKGAYMMPVAICEHLKLPGTSAAREAVDDGKDGKKYEASVHVHTFSSSAGLTKVTKQYERELEKNPGRKRRGVLIYI